MTGAAAGRLAATLAGLLALDFGAAAAPLELAIARAYVKTETATGEPVLDLTLAPPSATAFGELTQANIGKVVELRIDGKVILSPIVRDPILGGVVEISGRFSRLDLLETANRIWSGNAKVEVEPHAD